MSTQFYTTDQQTPYQQTPPQGNGPSRFRTWALVVGAAVAAAIIALASVLAFTHSSSTPATSPSASTSAPAGGTTPVSPAHPVTPVQPSAAVMQLQRELGQLNYYEGPVDGLMGPQTIAAIKDLQRQANLPQTGVMNSATQTALAYYLAHGNNQMGGNS
jgi:peptidoglycan hydrolase-like protein with peptidoglycan-binding domain